MCDTLPVMWGRRRAATGVNTLRVDYNEPADASSNRSQRILAWVIVGVAACILSAAIGLSFWLVFTHHTHAQIDCIVGYHLEGGRCVRT